MLKGKKRRDLFRTHLSLESLEDRLVLAAVSVDIADDADNAAPNINIADLIANPGSDGKISLREAVRAANFTPGPDIIDFHASLNGATILLDQGGASGQLLINDPVTIDATALSKSITIDASGNDITPDDDNGNGSRIFSIVAGVFGSADFAFSFKGLNLTGADSNLQGGAIAFTTNGTTSGTVSLTIEDSHIFDNHARNSGGGGVSALAGIITISGSTFTNNRTVLGSGGGVHLNAGFTSASIQDTQFIQNQADLDGGGMYVFMDESDSNESQLVTVSNSSFTGNKSFGGGSLEGGGGIFADLHGDSDPSIIPRIEILRSTVSGNHAENNGGGILVCAKYQGEFLLSDSTVSGNDAGRVVEDEGGTSSAKGGDGGGVWVGTRPLHSAAKLTSNIENTTISGNSALSRGGGLWAGLSDHQDLGFGETETFLDHVTITDNHVIVTNGNSPEGGGLFSLDDSRISTTLTNTIVSNNTKDTDVSSLPNNVSGSVEHLDSAYNLLGSGGNATFLPAQGNPLFNIHNDDPGLFPLASNGGLTLTHRPMLTSLAIDTGDPNTTGFPDNDQRGEDFPRVYDSNFDGTTRIDIGAYEIGLAKVIEVAIIGPNMDDGDLGRYSIPTGDGNQIRTVPIGGADIIEIAFSEELNSTVLFNSLSLIGATTAKDYTVSNTEDTEYLGYDTATSTMTWGYTPTIESDQWWIDMMVLTVADTVTDTHGRPLDGEWLNPVNVNQDATGLKSLTGGSGDGQSGGDFEFIFTIFPGDINGDVTGDNTPNNIYSLGLDSIPILGNLGNSSGTYFEGNFNGQGGISLGLDLIPTFIGLGINLQQFSLAADFDNDYEVTQAEVDMIMAHYGDDPTTTIYDFDLNNDNKIDVNDYNLAMNLLGINLSDSVVIPPS